jgi:DNA invertase Pin-like site-specific DNA recombinase
MNLESTKPPDDPLELPATRLRPAQIRASHLEKRAIVYARQSTGMQVREHTGSTMAQRELVSLPRLWGWPESRIEVIEDDLGLSGTSAQNRTGLHRLYDLMDRGEAGLIVVREVSRYSRNPHDAEIFLKKLIDNGILLYAGGQLFDGATEDLAQLFGLRIQNLLAWYENQNRALTMRSARTAKALQGHAVTQPSVGYVKSIVRGKWIKDPDIGVQEATRRVFDLYRETGSIGNAMRYMRRHNLPLPRRRGAEVRWRLPSRSEIAQILTNPNYTGDYVFQRTKRTTNTKVTSGQRTVRRSQADWITARNHHEPYVTRDEWQAIQTSLASRRPRVQPPVGRGYALLQGLVRCSQCKRWLSTHYQKTPTPGARSASYVCMPRDRLDVAHYHLSCGTKFLDAYVVRRVLDALKPVSVRAALEAIDEHGTEQAAIAKAQRRHVQQAQDDVEAARQRYALADPNHRLVRADLEAQLEHALAKLDALKREMAVADPAPPIALKAEDARDLIALSERVEALWDAPTTTNEDRKRLLRLVLTCVLIHEVTDEAVELEIVWASGLQERYRLLRSAGVAAHAYALALTGETASEIAAALRVDGVTTTYGRPVSTDVVASKLRKLGITAKAARHDTLVKIRTLLMDGRRREILDVLNRDLAHSQRWTPHRLSHAVTALRRGAVPDVPPLPPLLPEARKRDAILQLITQRREAGCPYATIAAELNASGRRPKFAARFSAAQVSDLLRSRRVQAQTLGDRHKGDRHEGPRT